MRRLIAAAVLASYTAFCAEAEVVYVNAPNGLNIRQEPGENSTSLQVLEFGQRVVVVDDEPGLNGWLRVGGDGYIDGTWTQKDDPKADWELLGEWRITAYAETGYPCANGNYPTLGYTVACNSLPFGTEVYIDGVGFRTVEDTDGGAMGNEWIDLYLVDYTTCVQWGDQYRKVWLCGSD
jgi:3D (Asp-Asp-Asp) domain-containing protein